MGGAIDAFDPVSVKRPEVLGANVALSSDDSRSHWLQQGRNKLCLLQMLLSPS